jgi:S-adenosylmethionine:tRNA ribosyltransferase-isomerase
VKLSDFRYDLPPELIAQYPADRRRDARLLAVDGDDGTLRDLAFPDIVELVRPGDLVVFNDTRVIRARLFGRKETGGRVEVLIERMTGPTGAVVQIRASKPPKAGAFLLLEGDYRLRVTERLPDGLYALETTGGVSFDTVLTSIGHVPLPPYIERQDQAIDQSRYQTVYAREPGAVAAPTAGLHFDRGLLDELRARGVELAFTTLHVGAGTFQPVRVDDIADHRMHAEHVRVDARVCAAVDEARDRSGRVIAVGTTSTRALETAAASGALEPYDGDTRLFIYPGYRFRVVDVLLTNFHLPESTLLMLVCAFAGRANVLGAYAHAVAEGYRFYSYGDAMWLTPAPGVRIGRAGGE